MIFCELLEIPFWVLFALGSLYLFFLWRRLVQRGRKYEGLQLAIDEGSNLSPSDLYHGAIQSITSAESTTWNRTYNFLTANSILILAWATFFASSNCAEKAWILIALSSVGVFLSVVWAPFSSRSRKYLELYMMLARDLERSGRNYSKEKSYGPIDAGEKVEPYFLPFEKFSRAKNLAVLVPLVFAAAFFFFLLVSICLIRTPH